MKVQSWMERRRQFEFDPPVSVSMNLGGEVFKFGFHTGTDFARRVHDDPVVLILTPWRLCCAWCFQMCVPKPEES